MPHFLFALFFWNCVGSTVATHYPGSVLAPRLSKELLSGRRVQSESEAACDALKTAIEEESEGSDGVKTETCGCEPGAEGDNSTELSCIRSCQYCNDELTTCGQFSEGELFDENGNVIAIIDSFTYTKGRNELVTIRNTGCSRDMENDLICDSCQVFVDGTECESCELKVCTDGIYQGLQLPAFSCTNVESDAVVDQCEDPLIVSDDSVFAFFSTEGDEYSFCYLPTEYPSGVPSDMPSLVPSGAPSDIPSDWPSLAPSVMPTNAQVGPTDAPVAPTDAPVGEPIEPAPTASPIASPVTAPTFKPAPVPEPTIEPTAGGESSSLVQYSTVCSIVVVLVSVAVQLI